MTVAFFSNYLSHHQLPFCLSMAELTGGNFTFVATEKIPEERLSLRYSDMNNSYGFVLREYEDPESAMKISMESDVIILGSAPEKYIVDRIKAGRLSFRYSERLFKRGYHSLLSPRVWYYSYLRNIRFNSSPLYMLCSSAYTAADYSKLFAYKNKCFKWGYFPPFKEFSFDGLFSRKSNSRSKVSLLWTGRLLDWKHPEEVVYLARQLKAEGYKFEVNIVGSGPMEAELTRMIGREDLGDTVHMRGSAAPETVRKYMEAADIFIFTSDFNEGWGAVVNEAMNSGCAVVASHAAGSVPFLIQDKCNGLIYRSGNNRQLYAAVRLLMENPDTRIKLGKNAYKTIAEVWNAEEAAKRFLILANDLSDSKTGSLPEEGPCSLARRLENGWYR